MRKLLAAVWKELLLLLRDRGGVAILFVMPTAMVLITTLVQEDALRAVRGGRTSVLVAVAEGDSFGAAVAKGLAASGAFTVVRELRRAPGHRGDDPRGAARRDLHHRDRRPARRGRAGRRRRRPAPRPDDAGGDGAGRCRRRAAGGDRGLLRPGGARPVPPRRRHRAGAPLPGRRGPGHDGQDPGVHERRHRQAGRRAPSWEAEPHITVRELFTGAGGRGRHAQLGAAERPGLDAVRDVHDLDPALGGDHPRARRRDAGAPAHAAGLPGDHPRREGDRVRRPSACSSSSSCW